MSRSFVASLAVIIILLAATPTLVGALDGPTRESAHSIDAQEEGHGDEEGAATRSERRDGLDSVVIWSLVGLGLVAITLAVLYFFKRQVGGFPENPAWVAPITIMPSKDFPDEGDFGDVPPAGGH